MLFMALVNGSAKVHKNYINKGNLTQLCPWGIWQFAPSPVSFPCLRWFSKSLQHENLQESMSHDKICRYDSSLLSFLLCLQPSGPILFITAKYHQAEMLSCLPSLPVTIWLTFYTWHPFQKSSWALRCHSQLQKNKTVAENPGTLMLLEGESSLKLRGETGLLWVSR